MTHAFFIVGPTASGKTDVAHYLAKQSGQSILSADSMLVYREMNIGTAKPEKALLEEVDYLGIDLVSPDVSHSTGTYIQYVRSVVPAASVPIVAGGTGLYISALTLGLDELPEADPVFRRWAEGIVQEQGLAPLREELEQIDPERFKALKDPANPRRVIRALELARRGPQSKGAKSKEKPILTGLKHPREVLYSRVEQRVYRMYEQGLLDEAEQLKMRYPQLSDTALQAIGYREAFAVLENKQSKEQAIEQTIIRTRRLAKRQETWFRHQAHVHWVDVRPDDTVPSLAQRVQESWKAHGPTSIAV